MTTNKPEVVGFATHHDEPMLLPSKGEATIYCDDGEEPVALIRLSDYKALQAECDRLQAEYEQLISYTKNGIECFASPCTEHSGLNAPPFYEFQERYGSLCLMCVVDERDALRVECERWKNSAHGAHRQLTTNRLETEKLAVDWSKAMAECEKLRKTSSELANWCFHEVGVDIEVTPGLKQVMDITGVVYDEE